MQRHASHQTLHRSPRLGKEIWGDLSDDEEPSGTAWLLFQFSAFGAGFGFRIPGLQK